MQKSTYILMKIQWHENKKKNKNDLMVRKKKMTWEKKTREEREKKERMRHRRYTRAPMMKLSIPPERY